MPSVPLVSQISLLATMPHHLGEAQRDDGQIVAAQPRGDQRHHGAGRRGEQPARPPTPSTIGSAAALGGQRRDVGAEGEEADEAEIDHPGHAPDQVEAERHERVEAGEGRHRDQVVLHLLVPSTLPCAAGGAGARWGRWDHEAGGRLGTGLGWAPPRGGRTGIGGGNESQRPHLAPAPPAAADRSAREETASAIAMAHRQYARSPRMPRGRRVSTSRMATKPTAVR